MDNSFTLPATPPRSAFVSVLAWIYIVFGALATLFSLLQNASVTVMMARMNEISNSPAMLGSNPLVSGFILNNMRGIAFGSLLLCAFLLTAAIGLLKRKNWARITFICFKVLGSLWCILMLICIGALFIFGGSRLASIPNAIFIQGIMAFYAVFVLAFLILYIWIIIKLTSPKIRAEFIRKDPV